jgi:hypothetical protein
MSETIELKNKKLKKLIETMKKPFPSIEIGILGNGNARPDGKSNAVIGRVHEFGDLTHPERSFLRMPLTMGLNKALQKSDAFSDDVLKEILAQGTFIPWAKKVALCAESLVLEAFDTNGFGRWHPWKPPYKSKTGKILVNDTYLRDSISSRVK